MKIKLQDYLPIVHRGVNSVEDANLAHSSLLALIKLLPEAEFDSETERWNFTTVHHNQFSSENTKVNYISAKYLD